MSALPSLNIPIAVNTSRMESDLRDAERKMKASAARMGRIRAATTPAVGALGGGAVGSVLGGVAAAGGGSLAALGLAAAVPIYGLARAFTAIQDSATGALKAMQEGNQQFAANQVHMQRLVRAEAGAAGGQELNLARSFTAGAMGGGGATVTGMQTWWESMKTNLNSVAAWWGSFIETGSTEMADLEKQLAEASPYEARQILDQIRMLRDLQSGAFGEAGQLAVRTDTAALGDRNLYEYQTLKQLREMNGKI